MANPAYGTTALTLALLMTTTLSARAQPALTLQGKTAEGKTTPTVRTAPQVQEIVVTANKRSESINKVGLSVTAIGGQALLQAGVTTPEDLEKVVPGFHYAPSLYGTPTFTLRGVGLNSTALEAAPAVSVYVDEVPLPYPSMTQGVLLDVARVEALKGPQGVLFGNNSTGGAVNFIAAGPTSAPESGGELTYARFNAVDAQGYVSGPLTQDLTGRLSFRTEQGGAWQQSETRPHDSLGDARRIFARILLDYKPTDQLTVRLNVNGWIDGSDTQARRAVAISPLIPGTLIGLPVDAFVPAGQIAALQPPASGNRAADWDPGRDFRNNQLFGQASLRVGYALTDAIRLTSITAYSALRPDALYDSDGTSFPGLTISQKGRIDSFFQELRADVRLGSRASLLLGVNYAKSSIEDSLVAEGNLSSYNFFLGNPHATSDTRANTDDATYAIFSRLEYRLLDNLKLIGAARATQDHQTASLCSYDIGGAVAALQNLLSGTDVPPNGCITTINGVPGVSHETLSEGNISWRAGLEWQATPNSLLYVTANRGYKAGGFPNVFAFSSTQFKPVAQEKLNAYEIGAKLGLLHRHLQLNAAVFHYDYDDKQIQGRVIVPALGPLETEVNVPKSTVNGAELQATAVPIAGLSLQTGVTYVDTKIGSGTFAATPFGAYVDVGGEHFPDTPEWQVDADASYEAPLNDRLTGFVGASAVYTGSVNGAFGNLAVLNVPDYTVVDARIGIAAPDDRWRVTLFARNLADATYYYSAQQTIDVLTRFYGEPRTYGITLQGRF